MSSSIYTLIWFTLMPRPRTNQFYSQPPWTDKLSLPTWQIHSHVHICQCSYIHWNNHFPTSMPHTHTHAHMHMPRTCNSCWTCLAGRYNYVNLTRSKMPTPPPYACDCHTNCISEEFGMYHHNDNVHVCTNYSQLCGNHNLFERSELSGQLAKRSKTSFKKISPQN